MAFVMTVSVIMPTYNREELLRQALESLLRQTRAADEIIVIDDGSTDHTQKVLARFASSITVITQPHLGRSQARNAGLRAARSELIAFLDDDDLLPRESIEQRVAFLEAHPTTDVVYTDALVIDALGHRLGVYNRANRARPSGRVFMDMAYQNLAPIHAYMFRRTCLEETGRFDTTLSQSEDWDFWIRMAAHHPFAYLNAPLVYYRFHSGMSSHHMRDQLAASGLEVQQKIFDMPAFKQLTGYQQARLYTRHASWRIRINDLANARLYYHRAIQEASLYFPAYLLLVLVRIMQWIAPEILASPWVRKIYQKRSLY